MNEWRKATSDESGRGYVFVWLVHLIISFGIIDDFVRSQALETKTLKILVLLKFPLNIHADLKL